MAIPALGADGFLPPGIHAATLREVTARFAAGGDKRPQFTARLESVIAAALRYPTIKRVLLWGSYVTTKVQPADLDYSVVVVVDHDRAEITEADRRYLTPSEARRHFNVDPAFLIVRDYPLEYYIERLDFMCRRRDGRPRGIIEISLRGETAGGMA